MNISPLSVAKFVVSGIVGIGTGKIVGRAIKNTITPETIIEKVSVCAAAWVIGAIATETTKKYTDDMIDDIVKNVSIIVNNVKLNEKVDRVNKGKSTFEKEGLDPERFRKNENNIWVFKDSGRAGNTMHTSEVVKLIESDEWTYDPKKDLWSKKNESGKAFRQIRLPDGKALWVWVL